MLSRHTARICLLALQRTCMVTSQLRAPEATWALLVTGAMDGTRHCPYIVAAASSSKPQTKMIGTFQRFPKDMCSSFSQKLSLQPSDSWELENSSDCDILRPRKQCSSPCQVSEQADFGDVCLGDEFCEVSQHLIQSSEVDESVASSLSYTRNSFSINHTTNFSDKDDGIEFNNSDVADPTDRFVTSSISEKDCCDCSDLGIQSDFDELMTRHSDE